MGKQKHNRGVGKRYERGEYLGPQSGRGIFIHFYGVRRGSSSGTGNFRRQADGFSGLSDQSLIVGNHKKNDKPKSSLRNDFKRTAESFEDKRYAYVKNFYENFNELIKILKDPNSLGAEKSESLRQRIESLLSDVLPELKDHKDIMRKAAILMRFCRTFFDDATFVSMERVFLKRALDAGYNSVSTFQRAVKLFLQHTEFRQEAYQLMTQSSILQPGDKAFLIQMELWACVLDALSVDDKNRAYYYKGMARICAEYVVNHPDLAKSEPKAGKWAEDILKKYYFRSRYQIEDVLEFIQDFRAQYNPPEPQGPAASEMEFART